MSTRPSGPLIRDAATVIAYRDGAAPEVLMGQRGSTAAFMPDKFVFPGGAVDPLDAGISLAGLPDSQCQARLSTDTAQATPTALMTAAIRELWEETGLLLGRKQSWADAPEPWQGFARAGYRPDASALRFVFRAITPRGRPRRFDARFFLVHADRLAGSLSGDGELAKLQWIPLEQLRDFSLPFITQVVLAELPALIADPAPPARVPFFRGQDEEVLFEMLGGRSPLDPS